MLLSLNSDVIAINVRRWLFLDRRVEMNADPPLHFSLKALVSPSGFDEDNLGITSGEGAAGNVAGIVSAGAHGGENGAPKSLEQFGKVLNRDPVQLDILPHRQVGRPARIFLGHTGDGSKLMRMKQAIGD